MTDASLSLDTAFKLAELLAIVGGGAIVVFKMGKMTERFELIGVQQAKEISELKTEMKSFSSVLTLVAVQKEQIDNAVRQVNLLDQRFEELRHGEGFVYPLAINLPKTIK